MENYYQILGVKPEATIDEIRSRYRFLAKAYHPDRFGDAETKAQAEAEMKRINEAYAVLSNPDKRKAYDENSFAPNRSQAAANAQDEGTNQHLGELIQFLQQVQQRWTHLLDEQPNNKELDEVVVLLKQGFVTLLDQVYPGKKFRDDDPLFEDFDKGLVTLIANNVCLGAEFEISGHPRRINPVELEIISTFPLQQVINQVMEEGRRKRTISESGIQKLGETFSQVLFALCELSQAEGRERVNAEVKRAAAPPQEPAKTRKPEPQAEQPVGSEGDIRYCQSCRKKALTHKVTFHQNIGAVILRFHRKVEGYLCAECIEKYFWQMTGITLLFGWWGIISFFSTPFILLINLVNYLDAGEVRKSATHLGEIQASWKATVIITIILIGVIFIAVTANQNSGSQTDNQSQVMAISQPNTNPTHTIRYTAVPTITTAFSARMERTPTPRPRQPECLPWNSVSASDKGKILCVQGIVKNAYQGGDIFYMAFSDDPNDFRMIVLHGYYYKDIQGLCVMAEGEVKAYDQMPYIEVRDNLFVANDIGMCR